MSELVNDQPAAGARFSLRSLVAAVTDAETDTVFSRALGLLLVTGQFAVVLFLVWRFRLEDDRFLLVVQAAFAGFLVHQFLPLRWRLPFFVTLSLGTVGYFLGLEQGQWHPGQALARLGLLLSIGVVLIGICHLPLRFWTRVGLLVLAGGALAVFRTGRISVAHLNAIWPILGAMFMFRLMVYLYDREHEKEHGSLWQVFSYFFLFPCVWIFVFPVIDYKNFRRGYYNDRAVAIYQKGLGWMMRGVVQLLIWRLVYYHVYLDPSRVSSGADLVQYMVGNVALYLRVSGQFHFAIGLLHLFGFNLPETNRRYFLASSFTDYWRRATIYWKDFMMKLFYYPAVVRLKRWGTKGSVLGAIGVVFVLTWALHSYQWFWLRGDFPVAGKDIAFWGLLGLLVMGNSVWELKAGRQRSLGQRSYGWRDSGRLGLRTAATFGLITLLWSIWSADSLGQWLGIWKYADSKAVLYGSAVLAAVGIAAVVLESPASRWKSRELSTKSIPPVPWQRAMINVAIAATLTVCTTSLVTRYLSYENGKIVQSLFQNLPNKTDRDYLVRGYYENLTDTSRFNGVLYSAFAAPPVEVVDLKATSREAFDLRTIELVASKRVVMNGIRFQTNSNGFRDREYDLAKSPDTFRAALLGSSVIMGSGVGDDEVFETLVEERLNQEFSSRPWKKYELLNFSVGGYSSLSLVDALRKKALAFKPDAALYFAHDVEFNRATRWFARAIEMEVEISDPVLKDVINKAGIRKTHTLDESTSLLQPYGRDLVQWAYRQISQTCRESGIQAIWIFLPGLLQNTNSGVQQQILELAKESGFITISLDAIYDNLDPSKLMLTPTNEHPNPNGHRVIADAVYRVLTDTPGLRIGISEHLRKASRPATHN